jgi:hypothetical protein
MLGRGASWEGLQLSKWPLAVVCASLVGSGLSAQPKPPPTPYVPDSFRRIEENRRLVEQHKEEQRKNEVHGEELGGFSPIALLSLIVIAGAIWKALSKALSQYAPSPRRVDPTNNPFFVQPPSSTPKVTPPGSTPPPPALRPGRGRPNTEAEWLACGDPTAMLQFLRLKPSDRKFRLFAVACCRRVWHLIPDKRSQAALVAAEQFADGLVDEMALDAARNAANDAERFFRETTPYEWHSATQACEGATASNASDAADRSQWCASFAIMLVRQRAGPQKQTEGTEHSAQAAILCDLYGSNPFRPLPPLSPAVLAWNDRTVPRLAQAIYDDRKLAEGTLDNSRLAILADALLDAGCDEAALVAHLRSPGPHVRGCWAVDVILGKS